MFFFTGYQYGYGLPGMPGFNPFLLNSTWLDAAYLSTYGWGEYFRTRNTPLPQQSNLHQPLIKTTSPQLPTTPNLQASDFYVNATPTPTTPFHPPNFLPSTNLLPQFNSDLSNPFHLRPVSTMEQLSLRLSPISNTQSLSPQQNLTHDSRINSTVDQSNSENEIEEDEDEIDVVKSAFHPIKAASLLLQEIQHPDSTVKEEPIKKCELKAISSKKITIVNQKSPGTKLHTTTTTKNVWRPY